MRAPIASLSRKTLFTFFAVTLTLGLVPASAFAASDSLQSIPEGSEGTASVASSAEGGSADVFSHCPSDDVASVDGSGAVFPSGDVDDTEVDQVIPAADIDIINQVEPLQVVAQTEVIKNFFLAQTLESTRTVPVVSASLPIDTGALDGVVMDGRNGSDDAGAAIGIVAADSTVIGSFEYLGMTFAIEPGGESVALMAVDYDDLPKACIEQQVVIIPGSVTPDEIDNYSVTRIADEAFASLKRDDANPEYVGCEILFSDDELLADADIDEDSETDASADPLMGCTGILVLGIPAPSTMLTSLTYGSFPRVALEPFGLRLVRPTLTLRCSRIAP